MCKFYHRFKSFCKYLLKSILIFIQVAWGFGTFRKLGQILSVSHGSQKFIHVKFSKFYVSEHQKILFVTICILVVCKLLFFRFIRNRTAPALRKKCGKTCESPVKCILVNFSVCFNWVELLLVFLVLKYKIQIMIQKTNRFIDNLTSNIWNMVNFKNLLNF